MKRGLVLSGGGAKGAYEIGVLQYLVERGWKPDVIAGTSFGSFNAALLLTYGFTEKGVNKIVQIWKGLDKNDVYRLFRIPTSLRSIADNGPLRKTVEKYIDARKVINSEIELLIASTVLQTMKEVVTTNRDPRLKKNPKLLIKLLMASMAIPVIFPPEKIGRYQHVDGGVGNNTPISDVIKEGCDQIVAVVLGPKKVKPGKRDYSNPIATGWRAQQVLGYNTTVEDIQRANEISEYIRAWEKAKEEMKKIADPELVEQTFGQYRPFPNKGILDIQYVRPKSALAVDTDDFGSGPIPYVIHHGKIDARTQLNL